MQEKINKITGQPIPLTRDDVDTDLIIPAQYLTAVTRKGYGENLFRRLRENDKDFVFNQPQYAKASILVTQRNFGCGSSREHAVWALQEAGIQAIIAVSFADIFFNNSAKNSLVLITLPETVIKSLLANAIENSYQLTIDIEQQKIESNKNESYNFDIDPFRKHCLIQGIDELDYLLHHLPEIEEYEKKRVNK
jgi:3-isopropylmalate/(R)-2-methylmalate dehydratase small subunit